jgi:pyruvate ferredoxin oxidoreductase alpha subunit
MALSGIELEGHTVVAGLGGRAITGPSLRRLFEGAIEGRLGPLTFLDLNWELIEAELGRMSEGGRSGPHAENILREVGIVAGGSH